MPKLELLGGDVRLCKRQKQTDATVRLSVSLEMYVVPPSEAQVVFPFHKCSLLIVGDKNSLNVDMLGIHIVPASGQRVTGQKTFNFVTGSLRNPHINVNAKEESIEATDTEILIRGPGKIQLCGWCETAPECIENLAELGVRITLIEAVSDSVVTRDWAASARQINQDETIWLLCRENKM